MKKLILENIVVKFENYEQFKEITKYYEYKYSGLDIKHVYNMYDYIALFRDFACLLSYVKYFHYKIITFNEWKKLINEKGKLIMKKPIEPKRYVCKHDYSGRCIKIIDVIERIKKELEYIDIEEREIIQNIVIYNCQYSSGIIEFYVVYKESDIHFNNRLNKYKKDIVLWTEENSDILNEIADCKNKIKELEYKLK